MKKPQDSYDKLKSRALKIASKILRNIKDCHRRKIMGYYRSYEKILNEIQIDYPNLTEKEIHTTAVNRLRHQDVIYKEYVRQIRTKKSEYTDSFFKVMNRIHFTNPFLIDEIIVQIQKKIKSKNLSRTAYDKYARLDFNDSYAWKVTKLLELLCFDPNYVDKDDVLS